MAVGNTNNDQLGAIVPGPSKDGDITISRIFDGLSTPLIKAGEMVDAVFKEAETSGELGLEDSLQLQQYMGIMQVINQTATSSIKAIKDSAQGNTRNV